MTPKEKIFSAFGKGQKGLDAWAYFGGSLEKKKKKKKLFLYSRLTVFSANK
jgi:hypothetical protein